MIQLEYFPQMIEAHRNDLRAMAHPLPSEIAAPSWRRALGLRLIRLGRRIEGARPEIVAERPAALTTPTGAA